MRHVSAVSRGRSQQVTTRLQSGEATTAEEEGVNRTVSRQSSRAAPADVHHGGPRGAHAVTNRISGRNHSSGTTADGSSNSEAGGGAVEAQANARKNKRNQAVLGLIAMDLVPARQGNEINTAMRSNALLTCRLAVF